MKKITFWLMAILVVAAILVWGLRPNATASQSKAAAIGSGVSESPAPAAQAKADSRPAAQTVRLREEETRGLLREHRKANAAESKRATQAYLHLPLDFEANRGQAPESIAYVAHGPGYALGLSATKTRLSLQRAENEAGLRLRGVSLGMGAPDKRESSELQLQLLGANEDAKATGIGEQPGRSNYFIGNDPTKWRRGIAHYSRVKMTSVYPGVDLVFYGNPQQLEYDFVLAPGADAKAIRWEIAGAKKIWVNQAGDAVLRAAAGDVRLQRPVSYQEVEGKRKAVASKFRVAGRELRFELGEYDHSKELVIDPVLVFSLAIGSTDGIGGSSVNSVEVDGSGNIYFVATAGGTDFPSTAGPFDTNHVDPNAIQSTVGVVAKMDPTASTLIYSDFVGGTTGVSSAWYVAPDGSGNAFVGGYTNSTDYPLVNNVGKTSTPASCAISPKPTFICPNGFVFKLSADGSNLIFSSLIGGSEVTEVHVLQINPSSGELVVLGFTNSPDIVPAPTTLQKTFAGTRCAPSNGACANTYLLGLDPTTGAVRYQSFIGGAGGTQLASVQIDSSGALYLIGGSKGALSNSLGAVTHTYGPAGGAADGGYDILAMKLSVSAQNALSVDYITLIQGENDDAAMSNVVDGSGNQYFFGSTASSHLPVTAGVYQSTYGATGTGQCPWKGVLAPFEPNACGNGVVGKLSATGTLDFLTYLGGTGPDIGTTMGQDTDGNLWLGGTTSSSNFPFSSDAYLNPTTGGGSPLYTPFLAKMSNDGKTLPYATAVASSQGLVVNITTDNNDNVYVAGFASAVPTTPGVYPENPQTFRPAFLQEWNAAGISPVLSVTPTFLNFPLTATGAQSAPLTATIQNTGGGPMEIGFQVQNPFTSGPNNFLLTNNCGTSVAANGSCTLQAIYSPTLCLASQGCSQGNGQGQTLLVVTNAPGGPQTLTLTAGTGNGATVSVAPNPIVLPSQAAGTTGANLDVFVSNNGDLPLTVSTVAISGANATDFAFSLVSNGGPGCTTPVPSGGSSCQLEVSFKPGASATGTRNAQLVLTDSAIDSPQLIPLSGTVAGTTLNVTPTSFLFNTQAVGGSTTGSFTISNPGTSALQVSSITASGPNASEFSVTNGNCPSAPPFSLAGGASCLIDLGYTAPTGASGLRTATVTIAGPLLTGVPTVALSVDVVSNTQPSMSYFSVPSPLDFGGVEVGASTALLSHLLSFSNNAPIPCGGGATTCGAPLTISSISAGLSDYTIIPLGGQSYCTAPPFTIPSGGFNCIVQLVFTPSTGGNRITTLSIASNDPRGTVTLPLTGTGVTAPIATVTPPTLSFGNTETGVASPAQTVTLQNVGKGALGATTAVASANFTVASNGCNQSVAVGGSCTVTVKATPPAAGVFNGTLTLTNNAAFGGKQVVALTGIGDGGALLLVTPSTLLFQDQPTNTTSLPQTVTLANTGNVPVTLGTGAIRVSQDFTVAATTCGAGLAVGASCTIKITYTAASPNPMSGSLLLSNNAKGNPQPVYLNGNSPLAGVRASTTTLVSSADPVAAGQPVTFTASVAGTSSSQFTPAGTVFFIDGTTTIGVGYLDSTAHASFSTSSLTAGTHSITASYGADSEFLASTSAVLSEVVTGAAPAATTTAVTSSLNPSTVGASVTFTAMVSSTTAGTITGTVTFKDGATTLGTGSVSAGKTTFTTSALTQGTHSITAVYGGDATFAGSASTALSQVVNAASLATTTTAVASSLNPSTVGASVTFTAMVSSTTAGTITGTVTFKDGATTLGTGSVSAGKTTFTTSALTQGTHSITAVYGGDATFAGSTSTALSQVVNAASLATTTTAVASSLNPSTVGASLTFTATVSSTTAATITGTVTFKDGATTLGTGSVSAGKATFATSALTQGTHSITAVYGGDATFAGSTSTALSQMVNAATKAASTTALIATASTVASGTSVTFTATVSSTNAGTITGTVTFSDGAASIGTGTVGTGGVATLATSALTVGSHSITAAYGGDANYATSSSTAVNVTVTAAPDFTVAFNPASGTVKAGGTAMTTITVTPKNGYNASTSFACSGLPNFSTCTFSPATVTPNGEAASTMLTIATSVKMAGVAPVVAWRIPPASWLGGILSMVCLIGMLGMMIGRKRMLRLAIPAMVILLGAVLGIAGCNGHSGSSSITPTGTYTVAVTATGGAATHLGNFTLVVQ